MRQRVKVGVLECEGQWVRVMRQRVKVGVLE